MALPFSFRLKVVLALGLVVLADALFWRGLGGWTIGLFFLAWTAAAVITTPAILRRPSALAALAVALLLALLQIEQPHPLGVLLFPAALASAVLLTRAPFHDALRWTGRVAWQGFAGAFGLLFDAARLRRLPGLRIKWKWDALLRLVALPIIGGGLFALIFFQANPILREALGSVSLGYLDGMLVVRAIFWGLVFIAIWAVLRLRRRPAGDARPKPAPAPWGPALPGASIVLSLALFNGIFAIQNALDIAFLWSGAPLPGAVTLADYAQRGAYTLMLAAMLAGGFVLWLLRPDSPTGARHDVRLLVALWVLQTLMLVASCILRTFNYVEWFGLTEVRIFGLGYMTLVGIGLLLILWRLLANRSATWLINANALALAAAVLALMVTDLGAVAAHWNIDHAREAGGRLPLDVCYLRRLGPSAVVSVARAEGRADFPPALRARLSLARASALESLRFDSEQGGWRRWTWRRHRRVETALTLSAGRPTTPGWDHGCSSYD